MDMRKKGCREPTAKEENSKAAKDEQTNDGEREKNGRKRSALYDD